jgi:hypothetical protein
VAPLDDASLAVMRGNDQEILLLVLCTEASRRVDVKRWRAVPPDKAWQVVLTTGESRFVESGDAGLTRDAAIDLQDGPILEFNRPASVILRGI